LILNITFKNLLINYLLIHNIEK